LKVPWVTSNLPALISLSGGDKRPMVWNMQKMELGEHLDAFSTASYWKRPGIKQILYKHAWSFKPKNHSKSLLGPFEGKLQTKGFAPGDLVQRRRRCPVGRLKNPVHRCFSSLEHHWCSLRL
jgi:hypothetical protein